MEALLLVSGEMIRPQTGQTKAGRTSAGKRPVNADSRSDPRVDGTSEDGAQFRFNDRMGVSHKVSLRLQACSCPSLPGRVSIDWGCTHEPQSWHALHSPLSSTCVHPSVHRTYYPALLSQSLAIKGFPHHPLSPLKEGG